jgi:hypothetical protein
MKPGKIACKVNWEKLRNSIIGELILNDKIKKKLNKKELDWVAREWNWKEKQVKNDKKK